MFKELLLKKLNKKNQLFISNEKDNSIFKSKNIISYSNKHITQIYILFIIYFLNLLFFS